MRYFKTVVLAGLLSLAPMLYAQANNDAQIQADVQHSLDNKRYSNVQVAVHNGEVTLSGSVALYSAKEDADKKAHHRKGVQSVRNVIEVAGGGEMNNDAALREKLSKGLAYDRVGYGTTPFNNIEIGVQNGVVTLRGTVYGPADKDSAISLVENTPGVRDVVDELDVAPVSPMDDRIRLAEARAIYGFGPLNRYALDPAKTIRITVVNGHVTLNGVVDSEGDKNMAGIRANGVSGVFSVVNNLQVVGSGREK
jgi:hyperosmotically inducible periplasmic protein